MLEICCLSAGEFLYTCVLLFLMITFYIFCTHVVHRIWTRGPRMFYWHLWVFNLIINFWNLNEIFKKKSMSFVNISVDIWIAFLPVSSLFPFPLSSSVTSWHSSLLSFLSKCLIFSLPSFVCKLFYLTLPCEFLHI